MPNPRRRAAARRATRTPSRPLAPGPRHRGTAWVDDLRDHPPAPDSSADLWIPGDVDLDGPDPGPAPGDAFRRTATPGGDPDPDAVSEADPDQPPRPRWEASRSRSG